MDNIIRSQDSVEKYPILLPPIKHNRLPDSAGQIVSIPDRIASLEMKTKSLEQTNLKLVEIVYQMKKALEFIRTEPSTKSELPDTNNLQIIENRMKRVEQLIESVENRKLSTPNIREESLLQISNRLVSLTDEIESISTEKAKLENVLLRLMDEVTQIKGQIVLQSDMLVSTSNQLNTKTRRIHDEYLNNLVSITDKVAAAQDSSRQLADCSIVHREIQDDLANLRHNVKQVHQSLDEQQQIYGTVEANLAFRITDLMQKLNDEKRTRETEIRRLDMFYHDSLHNQDSTRMVLENHLSGLLSESESKLMDRESTSRVDIFQKVSSFERMLLSEKDVRNKHEKEMRSQINEVLERASSYQNETITEIRQNLQQNINKTSEAIYQIECGLRLSEQNTDEKLRHYFQITTAEISARKKLHENVRSDVLVLEERIRAATAAMQLAISGLANRIKDKSDNDELKQNVEKRIADFQLYMSRNFADIDSQLQQMTGNLSAINVKVESRIAQATSDLATEVRDTLSSVITWQANSTAHLREMQNIRVSIMQELSRMQLTLNHIESEIPTQMTIETDERINAIADIRHQMESLKIAMNLQPAVKEVDIDKIRESIAKLAETLQTMRSTMGMKIQSEQDIRMQQIKDLQTELRYLEEQFMLKRKPLEGHGKVEYYIKPTESEKSTWDKSHASFILLNQWSVYTAWRWNFIKTKLLLWKERAVKNKSKKPKKGSRFGGLFKKNKKDK